MHRYWTVSLLALVVAGAALAVPFDLRPIPGWPLESRTPAVAAGDINGDGLDDVVLASGFSFDPDNDHHVFVFLQRADGTLADPLKLPYAQFSYTVDLAIGDLDDNGINDIVVGYQGGVALLIADGRGGFLASSLVTPFASASTHIALMDVDRDGNLDVVAQYAVEGASVFLGDGSGGIRSLSSLATRGSGDNDVAVGDVTGDGFPDLVLATGYGSGFFVHPHNGVDGFGPAIAYPTPERFWSPSAIAIGDFNDDGINDLMASVPAGVPVAAVWQYPGVAAGGLGTPQRVVTSGFPRALAAADLDRDGRDDLVVGHESVTLGIGRYLQAATGLEPEALVAAPFGEGSSALAIGDVNDDGCGDVLVADFGLTALAGTQCVRPPARSDFDGDGRSDLFWRHAATGSNSVWLQADAGSSFRPAPVANLDWRVAGSGDFNGDGRSDVVWRNARTGAGSIWASANAATRLPMATVVDPAWAVVGIGDFDADGRDDLLWRNARSGANVIWPAGDSRLRRSIATVSNPAWRVVAVDDFNGDGIDDLLWRNGASGANAIWLSANHLTPRPVTAVVNLDWRVVGSGDFDADGQADVLWRNARSGRNALWHAARSQDPGIVRTVPNLDWEVAAVNDFDGNGKAEILWRNRATGENRLWRSTLVIVERAIANVPDPRWQVAR